MKPPSRWFNPTVENQGMVEGKVNKLKLIMRKLYGRANFDLLRAMVLAAEAEGL